MEAGGHPETAILAETWRLIAFLGFTPSVERCARCGAPPPTGEAVHFDLAGGAIICDRCRGRGRERQFLTLVSEARAELALLVSGRRDDGGALKTSKLQRDLLRDFIAYHLADQRPLNSFRFLDERLG